MTTPADPARPAAPTVREIAELTARLRDISARGRDVDPAERAAFLADKDALIARITATDTEITDSPLTAGRAAAVRERYAARDALSAAVRDRAEHPGYVLVGPSARTWLRDPVTGAPAAPVPEDEHRAVYELLDREELDSSEPAWVTGPDGRADVHSTVVPTAHTDTAHDPDAREDGDGEWWAQARSTDPDVAVATFDGSGYYSDAQIAAIGDALAAGDTEGAQQLQDRPWSHQRATADTALVADEGEAVEDEVGWPPMSEWMRERARRTEAEITAGTYVPGPVDAPALLAARLAELRAASGPSRTEEVITHAEAAERLTALGHDHTSAQAMVGEYLRETSRAVGVPVHQWGLDGYDVDAIAQRNSWVLDGHGQTLAQARDRAGGYAQYWTEQAAALDPRHHPREAEQVKRLVDQWTDRARAPEPFTHATAATDAATDADTRGDPDRGWTLDEPPADARVRDSEGDVWRADEGGWTLTNRDDENPGPHSADYLAQYAPLTALTPAAPTDAEGDGLDRQFDELCERHPLPGDGPGDWVTTRTGTFWDDYGEVDDDVSDEIATANPDIWDPPSPTGDQRRDPLSCLDSRPGRVDEQERREQLTRWHVDDQAADARTHDQADASDGALTRFTCGGFYDQPGGTP